MDYASQSDPNRIIVMARELQVESNCDIAVEVCEANHRGGGSMYNSTFRECNRTATLSINRTPHSEIRSPG